MNLQYLKNNEIDRIRWNACVQSCNHSLIYIEDWYLDIASPGWKALVVNDYEYVIPLNVKKKLGIHYIVQPPFSQQHGLFGKDRNKEVLFHIIEWLKMEFPYINIQLNSSNNSGLFSHYRNNYLLKLNKDYEALKKDFRSNTKRNIVKAKKTDIIVSEDKDAQEVFKIKKENNINNLSVKNLKKLKTIMQEALRRGVGESFKVLENEQVMAAVFLLKHKKRLTYIASASNNDGKKTSAMFLLVDYIIRKYAKQDVVLDFEGSMIPGVARFFQGFGAGIERYPHYQYKNLLKIFLQ